jgi:inhibitor of cysteine peptidase
MFLDASGESRILEDAVRTRGLTVTLTVLLACGSGTEPHPPVTATLQQAGASLELAVTQELRVRLPANPSTGYAWSFTLEPAGILAPLGEPAFSPDSPGVPGAGGVETFRFLAVRDGRATLRFDYTRPWEGDVPPLHRLLYHVRVR